MVDCLVNTITLVMLLSLTFINTSYASSIKQDPVLNKIVKLNPYLSEKKAKMIANEITKGAKRVGMDPLPSVAIAFLESSFQIDAVSGTGDYGMFQINLKTAKDFGIPINQLGTLKGQVQAHFQILKQKVKVCSELEKLQIDQVPEWTCYHSFTPKFRLKYYDRYNRLFIKEKING